MTCPVVLATASLHQLGFVHRACSVVYDIHTDDQAYYHTDL